MSLYQEVRPQNLSEIVGNLTTIGALTQMLKKPSAERTHVVLLKGPVGCGKTTIARIIAKKYGSNEDSTIKIHANNTNGIETVREISANASLTAIGGYVKTYIIDESHELTSRAQQGLLDILEDNPPHCYFVFCTTEPAHMIEGVRSRCTEYEVRLLQKDEIIKVLEGACEKKSIEVSSDIKEAISLTCDGSPRAALVSLEQVIGIDDLDEALELLVSGTEKDASVLDLLKLLIMAPKVRRKKWKQIITTFDAIDAPSETIRMSILTFLFNKLKKQESVEDAMDITHLLRIFSQSTYYGKKPLLGSFIAQSCFETWKE